MSVMGVMGVMGMGVMGLMFMNKLFNYLFVIKNIIVFDYEVDFRGFDLMYFSFYYLVGMFLFMIFLGLLKLYDINFIIIEFSFYY